MTVKDLVSGTYFTLREIEEPKENQVFIRGEYDRTTKKYECSRFSDISETRLLKGDKEVSIDFTF